MPAVVERAKANIEAAGLADRCRVEAGNFFEAVPPGADAYLMRHIIHDWDDEKSITILKNCRKAMGEHGQAPGRRGGRSTRQRAFDQQVLRFGDDGFAGRDGKDGEGVPGVVQGCRVQVGENRADEDVGERDRRDAGLKSLRRPFLGCFAVILSIGLMCAGIGYWLSMPRVDVADIRDQIARSLPIGTSKKEVIGWLNARSMVVHDYTDQSDMLLESWIPDSSPRGELIGIRDIRIRFFFDKDGRLQKFEVKEESRF